MDRFDCVLDHDDNSGAFIAVMSEDPTGKYIKYVDYVTVQEKNEKLKSILKKLILAVDSRENTMGDPIDLITAKEELQDTIRNARTLLSEKE